MGNFLKDLDKSQQAVQLVMNHFADSDFACFELVGKEEQKMGDIRLIIDEDIILNIEVKFDVMAEKTGNLCFELSNGKRMTGILETKADEVFYVVPDGKKRTIFKFDVDDLRKYILEPSNVKMKKGGDGWKFDLALVSIEKIIADKVAFDVAVINED